MKRPLTRGDKKMMGIETHEIDLTADPNPKKPRGRKGEQKVQAAAVTTVKKKRGWTKGVPRKTDKRTIVDAKVGPVPKKKPGWQKGRPRKILKKIDELPSTEEAMTGETSLKLGLGQKDVVQPPTAAEKGQKEATEQQATAGNGEGDGIKEEATAGMTSEKVCLGEEESNLFMMGIKGRLFSTNVLLGDIKRLLSVQNSLITEQNHQTKECRDRH